MSKHHILSLAWETLKPVPQNCSERTRVHFQKEDTGKLFIERVLRPDLITVHESGPAYMHLLLKIGENTWAELSKTDLRRGIGPRKSTLMKEIIKKYSKRVPDVGDECVIIHEGEICSGKVTSIDNKQATFNAEYNRGDLYNMLDVPYSKFRPL